MSEFTVKVKGFEIDTQKAINLIMEKLQLVLSIKKVEVRKDTYVEVSCIPFEPRQLGVFICAINTCNLETFNSNLYQAKSGDWIWWSTWVLKYSGNCMEVCSIHHNITKNTWYIKTEK